MKSATKVRSKKRMGDNYVISDNIVAPKLQSLRLNVAEINAVENYLLDKFPNFSAMNGAGRVVASLVMAITITLVMMIWFGLSDYAYIFILSANIPILLVRLSSIFVKEEDNVNYDCYTINHNNNLPIYSIMIAVYNETSVIQQLVTALKNLNWCKDKLDIIFLCEQEDIKTINAINQFNADLSFRTIILSKGKLKTKPRALQAGLRYVKGEYVVIYDAEDIPHPNQLLQAYQKFSEGDDRLAVIQAPLVPKNYDENFIAAQFTIDYACWYRVFIPYYSKIVSVFPLGGTSNHFKVDILRKVGGWDPANLTEDADLGMRLALFGYHAKTIDLPTIEEAPPKISSWIKQRTRWIQGHMQTIDIAMRNTDLSFKYKRFSEYLSIMATLMTGPFYGALRFPSLLLLILMPINIWVIIGFLLPELMVALIAITRDGRKKLLLHIALIPLYWLAQTIALYRAIIRTFTKPMIWEKTAHGGDARHIKSPMVAIIE